MPWQLPSVDSGPRCLVSLQEEWEVKARQRAAAESSHFSDLFDLLQRRRAPLQAGARWLAAVHAPSTDTGGFIPRARLFDHLLLIRQQPPSKPAVPETTEATFSTVLEGLPFRVQVNLLLLLCEERRHFPPRSVSAFALRALSLITDEASWTRQLLLDALRESGETEVPQLPDTRQKGTVIPPPGTPGPASESKLPSIGAGPPEGGRGPRGDHPMGTDGDGGLGNADGSSHQLHDPPAETIDGDAGGQRQPDGASSAAPAGGGALGDDAPLPRVDSPVLGAHMDEEPRAGEQRVEEEPLAVRGGSSSRSSEVELLGEELTCELQAGLAAMEAVAAREPGAAFPPRVAQLLGDAVAKAAEAGPRLLAGALRLDGASDTLFLLLCRQIMGEESSAVRAAAWAAGAVAPRLEKLETSAPAALLTALTLAGKRHPMPLVEGGFARLAGSGALKGPQCEVIIRVAKDALSPAASASLLAAAAAGAASASPGTSSSLGRQSQSQQDLSPTSNEHTVFLMQALMAHKPLPPLDSRGLEQLVGFFIRESAGRLGRSVKFVKCISTAVAAYGLGLAMHKSALRRALGQTKTFMTKAVLQKIEKL